MQIYLPVAELSLNVFMLLAIGLTIGFLSGMFGIGGGFIMTPFLIFLGVPPGVAVGTGASQVVAASVSSALTHWQRGNVDLQMGYLLIGGGLFGAIAGVKVLYLLKKAGQLELFVALAYVILLGVVGGLMLIESLQGAEGGAGPRQRLHAPRRPAHLDPGPALEAALCPFQALHQRHPAGGDRRLYRLAHGHHGRGRRLPAGAGHDLSARHVDPQRDRHLHLPDRLRHRLHHRAAGGDQPQRRRDALPAR